jgi:GMP synthase (glutamine-hydrolysing)
MSQPIFRLLQARDPDEPVRAEERAAFADKLGVPVEQVVPYDLLSEDISYRGVTEGADAVLVGGSGRYGINDDAPWLKPFVEVLGELAAHDFPTFASCFGFQGLVVALGETVTHDPAGSEVGTFEVSRMPGADDDPVFGQLPARFAAQMGHKDRALALPNGAVHLVASERCPYQALRLGTRVYATQFHPELSEADNRQRFQRYYREYSLAFGEEGARSILDAFQPSPEATSVLPRFADHLVR